MSIRRVLMMTTALALACAPLLAAAPQAAAATAASGTANHGVTPDANASAQNIYPDVRDPSLAANDRVAATVSVSSRNIVLHIDDPDDMAWAAINNGSPSDETWLDRSYDGAARPGAPDQRRHHHPHRPNPMAHHDVQHRQSAERAGRGDPGLRRARGPIQHRLHAVAEHAHRRPEHLSGRPLGLAVNDRTAAIVSVWSRNITLHIDDPDDMAWAQISNGSPTDETWLDRSNDGGQTWSTGSKLGDTTIPTGPNSMAHHDVQHRQSSDGAGRRVAGVRQSRGPHRHRLHAVAALHNPRLRLPQRSGDRTRATVEPANRQLVVEPELRLEGRDRAHGTHQLHAGERRQYVLVHHQAGLSARHPRRRQPGAHELHQQLHG